MWYPPGTGGGLECHSALESVEEFIGVCAECVQRAVFKHTLSEAAVLNIHLYAYLLSPAETILKLQEAFDVIQLNLNSLKSVL